MSWTLNTQQTGGGSSGGGSQTFDPYGILSRDWDKNPPRSTQEQIKADEERRQLRIREGQTGIDDAFSQFDDDYFAQYADDYTGNYFPQLEDQFADSQAKLIASLARRRMLESTSGANVLADLSEENNKRRTQIADEAESAKQDFRGNVERAKSDLYALNSASADPDAIGNRAVAEATSLVQKPTFTPLGDVFASIVQPFAAFSNADRNSVNPSLPWNRAGRSYLPTSSAGTGRITR